MKKTLALILTLMFCLSALSVGAFAEEKSSKYGGIYTTACGWTDSLNPALATARRGTWYKLPIIYDTLLTKNADDEYVPQLANSWEISEDGLTYTFHLRDDVAFHNGEKMNAEAVKATIEFYRDAEVNALGYAADECSCIAEVNVIDEFTVEFKLNATSGLLLNAMGDVSGVIIAPGAIEKYLETGDQFDLAEGGSGPFIISREETILEDKYVYHRNPNYWMKDEDGNQLPYLDGIVQYMEGDESTRVANLLSGDYNEAPITDVSNLQMFASMGDQFQLVESGSYLNMRYYFNSAEAPFDNVNVRKALCYAVDAEAIMEIMAGEFGFQLPWIVLESQSYYVAADDYVNQYDPEYAKELLAEAGYPDGFETVIYSQVNATLHEKIAMLVQEQLAQVGIKTTIEVMDLASIKTLWNINNPDMPSGILIMNTNIPRIDPWVQYNNDFGPNSATNFGKCLDEDFQAKLEEVKLESNEEKRAALLAELQQIGLDYYYLKLLYNLPVYYVQSGNVAGWQRDGLRGQTLWYTVHFTDN